MLSVPSYSVVVGVDSGHLGQLRLVLPTWKQHKPSLFNRPWIVFYDRATVVEAALQEIMGREAKLVPWPPVGVVYEDDPASRFGASQRYKMLSGFVHVPADYVTTDYWLKLDLDVVATGRDDWIRADWFGDRSAIVAHPWGYTKPPGQMLLLDEWAAMCHVFTPANPPLNLRPNEGSSVVRHKRIISWCAFFNSDFTRFCAAWAAETSGTGKLPVPSQDGFMWYMARRSGQKIVRTSMKNCGWSHCNGEASIRDTIQKQGLL